MSQLALNKFSKVLIAPLVSEKTTRIGDKANAVGFWVAVKATKKDIKAAVEAFFPKAKVSKVRTSILPRETKRFGQIEGRSIKRKKAYVTLAAGTEIDFAEFE